MKKKVFTLAGIAALSVLGTAANANTLVIDIGGMATGGDSIPDIVLTHFIGANAHVTGIGFDVTLETFGSSWASEAVIAVGNTGAPFVFVTPGATTSAPLVAPTAYASPIADLVGLGLDFAVGADGMLVTTLFESFDDGIPAPDGMWLAGSTVTVEYSLVPTPGSLALLALAGITTRRRRRRA